MISNTSLQLYLSDDQIQQRIKEMAAGINNTYKQCSKLTIITILKGSFMFASDLAKHITIPCQMEFIRLSSYGNSQSSSGKVQPVDLTLPNLNNEDILIIEDIVDTGLTLSFFTEYLNSVHQPKTIKIAVLLNKVSARQKEINIDFSGFTVGDEFLIGYGLDLEGYYRNLPYISTVNEG